MPKIVAALTAFTGVLTIITAISFARMPDPFVRQFGFFVVVLGTMGSVALIAAGAWQLASFDRRTASIVLVVLALGDVACNLAAFRLDTFDRVPIPSGLHAATVFSAGLVVMLAIIGRSASGAQATAPPHVGTFGAVLFLVGVIVGGLVVFSSGADRTLQPLAAAEQACDSRVLLYGHPERTACITREQAKPVGTHAFFTGLGGLGLMAVGTGMIIASVRPSSAIPLRRAFGSAALLVSIGALVVAARAGASDLDDLYTTRTGVDNSCASAVDERVPHGVIAQEEQAFRDCVVAAHGTNPWHAPFWAAIGIALPALVAAGLLARPSRARREELALHSA